ncbi:pyridoxal-5'-phosphate-dependent enzyme [Syntrophotalea carbinolica DSM 2380]|uniref:cysteine-S-conjugate beta-lyase n=1 Tax=Syntrophotalea carbinolica (strain DSM 2380 / NBRC 103641 / GraBd1) TaxID=338963 RepID=Q3A041_SYNC1|nr:PatB family C-S lyase [Syntrophotalea carbinolica]ABA90266.1 pyridoxal-5'-phosphate-dependent enzyme [Syntrophotalea carbinolica DSM 2380]
MFDFDRISDRHGTGSLKWDRYAGRDVLPLWVADMDFSAPPAVLDALQQRAAHGIFGYTHAPTELVEVIRERLWQRYHWRVEAETLVWLPGLVVGINVACRAVGGTGSEVLTMTPIYPPFLSAPGLSERTLVTIPMVQEGAQWLIDFDAMEKAVTPAARLLLLCSPQNPTGRVFTRKELEQLADFCQRHNLVLCSDEIHCDLVLEPGIEHIPTASLDADVAARTITLMAPSKTFNLPGLNCAFAIIPDAGLRGRFQRAMAGIVPYVNLFGYVGALAAYRDSGDWHAALLDYLRDNRNLVLDAVAAMPGLQVTRGEATYLTWIDARSTGLEDPAGFFEQAGVGLSDGREFGAPGFVRLNFGCPRVVLQQALERMRKALVANCR